MPSAPFVSFFLSTIIHFHTHSLFPLPFLSLLPFFLSFFLPFLSPFFSSFLSFSLSSRFLLPLLSLPFLVITGMASPNDWLKQVDSMQCSWLSYDAHCLFAFFSFSVWWVSLGEPRLVFSLPFPLVCPTSFFPLCVHPFPCLVLSSPRVCGGCHTPTLCPAVLLPLQSSLSVSLFHHHHPSSPLVCVKRVCVGKGKEDEQTCVIQKGMWKKGVQKEKQKTTCGVNTFVTNPGPNHAHTIHFTLLATSPAFLLL